MIRKYGIVLGAIAITLLMVSSATAVTNHVEPGIHINVMQKGILKTALKSVDDPDVRILLEEIIKKKGPVDSIDIEQILRDNPDIEVGTITFGRIDTGPNCGGIASCLRRPLCFIFVIPAVPLLTWEASPFQYHDINLVVDITIAGDHITYSHRGLAIGFVGSRLASEPVYFSTEPGCVSRLNIHGFSPLIIYQ